jgi:hypothetical protein
MRGRFAWSKEKRGWRRFWWYKEDRRVVGGGNVDEDAVVTMAQKRLVKGEKKTGEMLFFPNFSL